MRLPVSKVYRAFPELDRFSDEECAGFVQQAHRKRPLQAAGLGLAIIAGMVVGMPMTLMVLLSTYRMIEMWWPGLRNNDWWAACQLLMALFTLAGAAAIILFVPRDIWLRRTINNKLITTRCLACSYSLLGLGVRQGAIVCPECGQVCRPADRGLTPADFLATTAPTPASTG